MGPSRFTGRDDAYATRLADRALRSARISFARKEAVRTHLSKSDRTCRRLRQKRRRRHHLDRNSALVSWSWAPSRRDRSRAIRARAFFRLPAEQGLINRLGFPNIGVEEVARRLEKIKAAGRWPRTPVGLKPGQKQGHAPDGSGERLRRLFSPYARLGRLFCRQCEFNRTRRGCANFSRVPFLDSILGPLREEDPNGTRPLLIKIAPDLTEVQIADVANASGKIPAGRNHRDEHHHR